MSDCPDCEKQVIEAEEVKAEEAAVEAEEVKAEEAAAEENAEAVEENTEAAGENAEEKKPEDTPAVKILKSVGRVVATTIIVVGILFLIFKNQILEVYYEQCDAGANRELIDQKIFGQFKGEKGTDYNYTVEAGKDNNGIIYTIVVTIPGDDSKSWKFCWFPEWNTEKGELAIVDEDMNESIFKEAANEIENRVNAKKRADKAEDKAEEVKDAAADAAAEATEAAAEAPKAEEVKADVNKAADAVKEDVIKAAK